MADYYEFRVGGQIDHTWSDWFEGLAITHTADGACVLSGYMRDQAQVFGVLARIRDLALPLMSVNRIERDGPTAAGGPSLTL